VLERPRGSIVIPAYNEAGVIGRTLAAFTGAIAAGRVEVVVVPNGCTDATATVASSIDGVIVVELAMGSKPDALNAGDAAASAFPRLYLDADSEVEWSTVDQLFEQLGASEALAGRPPFRYETTDASWWVRAYYRTRSRIPEMNQHLWGAGAYALTAAGHDRLGKFPALTADDLWVDSLFARQEVLISGASPVVVRPPHTARALIQTLRRVYRGSEEIPSNQFSDRNWAGGTGIRPLLRTIDDLASALDAVTYLVTVLTSRAISRIGEDRWHRDESSRK